jgi:beta-galactosidase
VLSRRIRATRAIEPALLTAEPLRDTWIGCYAPYEAAAMVGGGLFADVDAAVKGIFSIGNMGMSGATSLTALLTLANVSWGALDLERAEADDWRRARQLWLPGLDFMARPVQERVVEWMRAGGHLVVLPAVPTLDERMDRCDVLATAIYGTAAVPALPAFEAEPVAWSQVRTLAGGSIPVAGPATALDPPPDATPLAWAEDGSVVAFRRPIGAGSAAVLGFRLQYHPVGGRDQFAFAAELVESAVGPRAASANPLPVVALEMAGPDGGMLCVVNPVELPASARVTYTIPGTAERATLPEILPGIEFPGRGAVTLPIGVDIGSGLRLRHSTVELLDRATHRDGSVRLTFSGRADESFEFAVEGFRGTATVRGGRLTHGHENTGRAGLFVVEAAASEVDVLLSGRELA